MPPSIDDSEMSRTRPETDRYRRILSRAVDNASKAVWVEPAAGQVVTEALSASIDAMQVLLGIPSAENPEPTVLLEELPEEMYQGVGELAALVDTVAAKALAAKVAKDEEALESLAAAEVDNMLSSSVTAMSAATDKKVLVTARQGTVRAAIRALREVRSAVTVRSVWARSQGTLDEMRALLDATREVAGARSEVSLSDAFEKLRSTEASAANWFRGFTIGLLIGSVVWTALVTGYEDHSVEMWRKLALNLPVLLLAGFLGRESSQHRRTARWAAVIVAQLRAIRAYTGELTPEAADDLRARFGQRVFLEAPELPGAAKPEGDVADGGRGVDVEALVAKAVDRAVERALGVRLAQ